MIHVQLPKIHIFFKPKCSSIKDLLIIIALSTTTVLCCLLSQKWKMIELRQNHFFLQINYNCILLNIVYTITVYILILYPWKMSISGSVNVPNNHSQKNEHCPLINPEIFCHKCKHPNSLVIPYQS